MEMETSNDTFRLLNFIGNECYKKSYYYFSLKAFDILERLDNEDHTTAKLACCAGLFKNFLLNKSCQEYLEEAIQIL